MERLIKNEGFLVYMDETLLETLGLTKGEVKVYLALNELGEATVGPIGKKSKVSKSKLYDILDRLIEKGLVGYIVKEGIKHFIANNPSLILDYVDQKEQELQKTRREMERIIPQLQLGRVRAECKPVAELYSGWRGITAIRDELMAAYKPDQTFLTMGCPKAANDRLEPYFLTFHKRRQKSKVGMRIIYNADAREYGVLRTRMKKTSVRYLPQQFPSPHWIDIFPEAVMFVLVLKSPLAFVVRDTELANSFRSYFEIMWENSTE